MTALAVVSDTATPCPVCGDDPTALFRIRAWGFYQTAMANCPLCLPSAGSNWVWRGVLEPYLKEPT